MSWWLARIRCLEVGKVALARLTAKGHLLPSIPAKKAAIERQECGRHPTTALSPYTSICSDISSASSISMPR